MKSKERENLRNLSEAELSAQLRELGKKQFQLKFKRTTAPLENPLELRNIRRKMAVIRTWLRERQLKSAAPKAQSAAAKGK